MEPVENTWEKSAKPSSYQPAEWVWTCQLVGQKIVRDHVEVDAIDAQGKITCLANGKRLAFLRVSSPNYDSYQILSTDERILVERSIHSLSSGPAKAEEQSDFSWD
jgi:hypothetical protein